MRNLIGWLGFLAILAAFGLALPRTLAGLLVLAVAVFVFAPSPRR